MVVGSKQLSLRREVYVQAQENSTVVGSQSKQPSKPLKSRRWQLFLPGQSPVPDLTCGLPSGKLPR